jgi:hypothetical protein
MGARYEVVCDDRAIVRGEYSPLGDLQKAIRVLVKDSFVTILPLIGTRIEVWEQRTLDGMTVY